MNLISPELAEVLACPVDKAALEEDIEHRHLVCTVCGRRYPVSDDGIPIMLVERAEGGPDE